MFYIIMAILSTAVTFGAIGYIYGKYTIATKIRAIIRNAHYNEQFWTAETLGRIQSIIDEAA